MLKKIPPILSPELVKVLMEMGHGDSICLADGNFPSTAMGQRVVRADGHNMPELLKAILELFPLDPYVDKPAGLMEVVPGDDVKPVIWETYKELLSSDPSFNGEFEFIPRFDFYDRARESFAVVATGEGALYANVLLTKGVIT